MATLEEMAERRMTLEEQRLQEYYEKMGLPALHAHVWSVLGSYFVVAMRNGGDAAFEQATNACKAILKSVMEHTDE